MTCERWEPLLSMYLDGELSAIDASRLEEHLDLCHRCRDELAAFREMSGMLATQAEPDPYFLARFRARRDETLWSPPSLQLWRRLALRLLPLAAAALVGAVAGVWLSMEKLELSELEARELGTDIVMTPDAERYPVLNIAFEPFPDGER